MKPPKTTPLKKAPAKASPAPETAPVSPPSAPTAATPLPAWRAERSTSAEFAAVFIDFENVYYHLKNHYQDPPDLNPYVLDILRTLGEQLREGGLETLISYAYADFERLASAPQGQLYLMGIGTRNVLGTAHKNAADMQLCIDALQVLYTRPEISTFVLVAGDRDYIPVLQHLRQQARQVLVAGFRESTSGDLLQNLGRAKFIDARELLTADQTQRLDAHLAERLAALPPAPPATVYHATPQGPAAPVSRPTPQGPAPKASTLPTHLPALTVSGRIARDGERRLLAHALTELERLKARRGPGVTDLWLTPFQRNLTDVLPEFSDYDRRELLTQLERVGALRIEKREGDPHPFSVIVMNYNHPDVKALHPGASA